MSRRAADTCSPRLVESTTKHFHFLFLQELHIIQTNFKIQTKDKRHCVVRRLLPCIIYALEQEVLYNFNLPLASTSTSCTNHFQRSLVLSYVSRKCIQLHIH
ncbi:unnamed protein product [Amoebophrya sp. A120]|nr:unnamed protein product [Amoebophrya sp. A120]|eukprot:GSA120T00021796001.1